MNMTSRSAITPVCVLSMICGIAHATQPPDVVKSDGAANTAMGTDVLLSLTTGYYNTGGGYYALYNNLTGGYNTAFGAGALFENTASENTAVGAFALEFNTVGGYNTALGYEALNANTSGGNNTAVGQLAMYSTTVGGGNVAIGQGALQANVTGSSNTAIGASALMSATGTSNIAIGEKAGLELGAGNNNVYIAASGTSESGAIRIGGSFQTATFISGISTAQVTGSAVYVNSSGQLGVLASSERFKTEVAPMGSATALLQQLRPVTFQLKTDPLAVRQYGLIAEEVDRVYPELVIRDRDGKIQGVRYEELAPMLLNEVQSQARELSDQHQQLAELKRQNQSMHEAIATLLAKRDAFARR